MGAIASEQICLNRIKSMLTNCTDRELFCSSWQLGLVDGFSAFEARLSAVSGSFEGRLEVVGGSFEGRLSVV